MCRFTLYHGPSIRLADLLTEPRHSLIHQSYKSEEREEPLNGDGFGVAWYAPELSLQPGRFRSVTPAWSNSNLVSIARVVRSHCVLAHVRAASRGSVEETNCHPFIADQYAFMHNGDVRGFSDIRRPLLAKLSDGAFASIEGRTDSEHMFALFRDNLRGGEPLAAMADALRATIAQIFELSREHAGGAHCYLNLAVADGTRAIACRVSSDPDYSDTLYVSRGRRYVCEGDQCRMVSPKDDAGAVIVSSEPLSQDPGWEVVPAGHLVLIDGDRATRIEPLAAGATATIVR